MYTSWAPTMVINGVKNTWVSLGRFHPIGHLYASYPFIDFIGPFIGLITPFIAGFWAHH